MCPKKNKEVKEIQVVQVVEVKEDKKSFLLKVKKKTAGPKITTSWRFDVGGLTKSYCKSLERIAKEKV